MGKNCFIKSIIRFIACEVSQYFTYLYYQKHTRIIYNPLCTRAFLKQETYRINRLNLACLRFEMVAFRLRATYRYKLVEIHDCSVCQEWGLECLDLQWMFGIQLCDSIFRRGEFPALPSSSLTKPPVWDGILFCTFGRHIFFSTHAGIYVGSWFFGILMR